MLQPLITLLLFFVGDSDPQFEDWEGMEEVEYSSSFMQLLASNDLIFVVLGVSLLIWFTLLFFIIRLDRKVSQLERQNRDQNS